MKALEFALVGYMKKLHGRSLQTESRLAIFVEKFGKLTLQAGGGLRGQRSALRSSS
jgi:hypothetical protein